MQTFCLAQRKPQKTKDHRSRAYYSRAALRDALKWAAAHAPAQLSLKVTPDSMLDVHGPNKERKEKTALLSVIKEKLMLNLSFPLA